MASAQCNCYRPSDTLIYKYTYNFKVGIRMLVQKLQHKTHNEIKVEIINVSILLLPPPAPPPSPLPPSTVVVCDMRFL